MTDGYEPRPAGRRVVVYGGGGFFGRAIVDRLIADGVSSIAAVARRPLPPRSGVEALAGDAEDAVGALRLLRAGDIVIDSVGPFSQRTPALLQSALTVGADYIDLNDNPDFAERVLAFDGAARASGRRVLTSCSSISVIPCMFAALGGVARPRRITVLLAPETHLIARPGSAATLLASLRQQMPLLKAGQVTPAFGWSSSRDATLPTQRGGGRYYLFGSADYIHLPRVFPTLRTVEFFVNSGVPLFDHALASLRRLPERGAAWRVVTAPRTRQLALPLVRALGRMGGAIGAEIEDESGAVLRVAITARRGGYLVPVAPAVLAARRLLAGMINEIGCIPHDRQVDPVELARYLRDLGFSVWRSGARATLTS